METLPYRIQHLTCPFEPSHRIEKHRLLTHLRKCQKNHPNAKTVKCPFNIAHVVDISELNHHMENCEDRITIELAFMQTEEEAANSTGEIVKMHPSVDFNKCVATEIWDDENVPSYNPQEHADLKPILRRKDIASKSERKQFRMQERARHRELDTSTKSTVSVSNSAPKICLEGETPIRPLSEILRSAASSSAKTEEWTQVKPRRPLNRHIN